MKVLIKQARIVCPSSSHHGKTKDILIENGIIESIDENIQSMDAKIVSSQNLHVSIGWMDMFAHFGDPGFEFRETIESGVQAAAAGGFTDVLISPNTQPIMHSKSQIEYIQKKSEQLAVNILPIGAITKNTEGKELTEMYDMQNSGAVAFSDGIHPVQHAGVLTKVLQYILSTDGLIIQIAEDKTISNNGLMNEGITSTQLGLKGIPAIAEELMIARDIELLKYTDSKLHITGVSTKRGLELISKAKSEGLNISCSVTPYHCFFSEEDLITYDTNLKVNPPLRTKNDTKALTEALLNGEIDCIASHHLPLHWDEKTCEFEYAKSGMIGLESLFGSINLQFENIEPLINLLTINPRKLLNREIPNIELKSKACITLFNPTEDYTFTEEMIHSKSRNSAFIGKQMKGKVLGIYNNNQLVLN